MFINTCKKQDITVTKKVSRRMHLSINLKELDVAIKKTVQKINSLLT